MKSLEDLLKIADFLGNKGSIVLYVEDLQFIKLRILLCEYNDFCVGSNYGVFKNNKDQALDKGFVSVYVNGVTFHFNTHRNFVKSLE